MRSGAAELAAGIELSRTEAMGAASTCLASILTTTLHRTASGTTRQLHRASVCFDPAIAWNQRPDEYNEYNYSSPELCTANERLPRKHPMRNPKAAQQSPGEVGLTKN
ncbi:hypothetical protein RB195_014033 [Necator americanus]|uniref:Uncharacterized protein n=1 Tax=Necator americanus TaxID=51031 RepID=A0ABR1DYB8_NECAM